MELVKETQKKTRGTVYKADEGISQEIVGGIIQKNVGGISHGTHLETP